MESSQPHLIKTLSKNSTTTNELFLCFTSRLSSSSSMKISKSILSPGRSGRDPSPHQISLSSSLSRRLKTNGSLKGSQSPMFPKKKSGSGFDNPEPSSPKVTCIGQVRVKSKKKKHNNLNVHNHHSNVRSRSQRRSVDYSFRRIELEDVNNGLKRQSSTAYRNREMEVEIGQRHGQGQGQSNQKWVHIPVTICESLKSFGSDFNCFLPCRSSCVSENDHRRRVGESGREETGSCGSVLARWLVAVQEGEGGEKGRQIELVVGGGDGDCGRRSYRKRHVMEDVDVREIEKGLREKIGSFGRDGEGAGGRVSICVPPKNALLLMRCGSDPVKMAALTNRFWEPPEKEEEEEEEETEKTEQCETERVAEIDVPETEQYKTERFAENDVPETEESVCNVSPESEEFELREDENLCDELVTEEMGAEARLSLEMERASIEDDDEDIEMETQIPTENQIDDEEGYKKQSAEEETEDFEVVTSPEFHDVSIECEESKESEAEEKRSSALPECLLLMMCEPKLSMEVSEETWVCSTDFIRWLPPRESKNQKSENDVLKSGDELSRRVSVHYKPPLAPPHKASDRESQQFIPPRSSCSYPAPPGREEASGESLLYRCKSEPRRSAAKLEGWFWKMEPCKPMGGGAAGVGV